MICERQGFADFVKVLDFGLAKRVGPQADGGLSSPNVVVGTPHFMAPEAAYGHDGFGPPADVYGVGLVGYFLLTGETVFDGTTPLALALAHVSEPPVPPSLRASQSVPRALEALIMRCLSKKPVERFKDGAELLTAIDQCDVGAPWTARMAEEWWRDAGRAVVAARTARQAGAKPKHKSFSLAPTERLLGMGA